MSAFERCQGVSGRRHQTEGIECTGPRIRHRRFAEIPKSQLALSAEARHLTDSNWQSNSIWQAIPRTIKYYANLVPGPDVPIIAWIIDFHFQSIPSRQCQTGANPIDSKAKRYEFQTKLILLKLYQITRRFHSCPLQMDKLDSHNEKPVKCVQKRINNRANFSSIFFSVLKAAYGLLAMDKLLNYFLIVLSY